MHLDYRYITFRPYVYSPQHYSETPRAVPQQGSIPGAMWQVMRGSLALASSPSPCHPSRGAQRPGSASSEVGFLNVREDPFRGERGLLSTLQSTLRPERRARSVLGTAAAITTMRHAGRRSPVLRRISECSPALEAPRRWCYLAVNEEALWLVEDAAERAVGCHETGARAALPQLLGQRRALVRERVFPSHDQHLNTRLPPRSCPKHTLFTVLDSQFKKTISAPAPTEIKGLKITSKDRCQTDFNMDSERLTKSLQTPPKVLFEI
ncbi:Protein of unknown function [Gryllus bimaculatus]|nr:Protein of unknown function [Gryllus bimaculatus]